MSCSNIVPAFSFSRVIGWRSVTKVIAEPGLEPATDLVEESLRFTTFRRGFDGTFITVAWCRAFEIVHWFWDVFSRNVTVDVNCLALLRL